MGRIQESIKNIADEYNIPNLVVGKNENVTDNEYKNASLKFITGILNKLADKLI